MKFTVDQKTLTQLASEAKYFLSEEGHIGDFHLINLTTQDNGEVEIFSTNGRVFFSAKFSAQIEEQGTANIPGLKFYALVESLSGTLKIKTGKYFEIQTDGSLYKFPIKDTGPLSPFSPSTKNETTIHITNASTFVEICQQVQLGFGHSLSSSFNGWGGIFATNGKEISLAATDETKLSYTRMYTPENNPPCEIFITNEWIRGVCLLLKKHPGPIDLFATENLISLKTERVIFTGSLLNQEFPDYKTILPTKDYLTVSIDRLSFTEAVKRLSSLGKNNRLKVVIEKNSITLNVAAENIEGEERIVVESEGGGKRAILNLQLVGNFLATAKTEKVDIVFHPDFPFITLTEGNDDWQFVLMSQLK